MKSLQHKTEISACTNFWDLHYLQILRIVPTHLILFLYFSPFWFIDVLLVQFCQGRVFPTSSYTVFCQDKDGSWQNKYCKSRSRNKNNIQDAADGSRRKFRDVVIALKLLWICFQFICVWIKYYSNMVIIEYCRLFTLSPAATCATSTPSSLDTLFFRLMSFPTH